MTKIRTEILIETNESLTIKRKRHSARAFCEECKRTSIMVLPTEAAFLSCRNIDSIIALMYQNRLHVRYLEKKGLFICLTSLCLFPFDGEFEDPMYEEDKEQTEFLSTVKTDNYSFINKE